MILSLDISTSITGFTILDKKGKLIKMDHVELYKIKDGIWTKVDKMLSFFEIIKKEYEITHIFIEEPLSKFKRGKSNSHTISLLLRFNGICSYLAYKIFDKTPVYINCGEARKKCGLIMRSKVRSKKDKIPWKPQKEQAFDQMSLKEPFNGTCKWDLKRTGKIKDYCYDRMDSFIIGKAGFISLK